MTRPSRIARVTAIREKYRTTKTSEPAPAPEAATGTGEQPAEPAGPPPAAHPGGERPDVARSDTRSASDMSDTQTATTDPASPDVDPAVDPSNPTDDGSTVRAADDDGDTEDRTYTKAEMKKVKDEAQKLRQRNDDAITAAVEAAVEKARKEAADAAAAERTALAESIGKAVGLITDEDPKAKDPEELIALATTRAEEAEARAAARDKAARDARVELALHQAASSSDADIVALTDSRKFTKSISGLDPDAADFADKLTAAVASAVESDARFRKAKTKTAAPRSTGDGTSGNRSPESGAGKPRTIDEIRAQMAKKRG